MQSQLSNIKQWLKEIIFEAIHDALKNHNQPPDPREQFLSSKEAAQFIGDALPTFYRRVSEGEIPTRGGGKKIWVRKSDLIAWLEQDRTYSKSQLEESIIDQMRGRRQS